MTSESFGFDPYEAVLTDLRAKRDQLDQTPIGGAISRITEDAGSGAKIQSRADDKADAGLLGGVMGAHDAGKAVAVGNGEGRIAQRMRRHHQLVRMRAALKEAEIGGDLEFGVHQGSGVRNQEAGVGQEPRVRILKPWS